MASNPIHVSGTPENNSVTHIDLRVYYPAGTPREDILDDVNDWLGESSRLVGVYELVGDGFGHLVPNDNNIIHDL